MCDKKLAAVRVLARVGHREDARAVVLEVGVKLVGQPVAGVACAVAQRAATLDHEILDHPVEVEAVIETVVYETEEVSCGLWTVLCVQSNIDISSARRHPNNGWHEN